MIELFNGSTTAQSPKHYSTKRTFIPTFELQNQSEEGDFCVCKLQCIPCLKFFTDEVGTDTRKNDFFTLFQNSIPNGSHKVFYTLDDWETEVEITNNDFGTLYNGTNWYGYEFKAFKVWQQIGYKEFSASLRNYDSSGELVQRKDSACRKLIKYSDQSANGTITIETNKYGILRHGNNYTDLELVGGLKVKNWRQQIRLAGSLEFAGFPTEATRLMMNDSLQLSRQVFEKGGIEYDLHIVGASAVQVMPVLLDDLFANIVYVSDYNLRNFEVYNKVRILRNSTEVEPSRSRMRKSFKIRVIREESNIEKFND